MARHQVISLFILCLIVSDTLRSQKKDLFVFIGQSNMAGRATMGSDTTVIRKAYLLNAEGEFVPAKNPLNLHSTIRKEKKGLQRLSPAYSFCKYYLSNTKKDGIRIIVQARGGTAIEKFQKGGDWGYYEATVNRIINCLQKYPDSELKAIFFHQGESNRNNPEEYLEKLRLLVENIRKDLNRPHLPFLCGELGQWNEEYNGIRAEMKKIPEIAQNMYLISSLNLKNQDDHHFDRTSTIELGQRFAKEYLKLVNKNPSKSKE